MVIKWDCCTIRAMVSFETISEYQKLNRMLS